MLTQIPINVFELGLKNGLIREPEYVIAYAEFLLGARLKYSRSVACVSSSSAAMFCGAFVSVPRRQEALQFMFDSPRRPDESLSVCSPNPFQTWALCARQGWATRPTRGRCSRGRCRRSPARRRRRCGTAFYRHDGLQHRRLHETMSAAYSPQKLECMLHSGHAAFAGRPRL